MARTIEKWKVWQRAMVPSLKWALLVAFGALCVASVMGQDARYRNVGRNNDEEKIPYSKLENWALGFGQSLWETARAATRFDAIQKRYHTEGAKIEEVDGFAMVTKMAANVEVMMQHKIESIKRIMELAENLALDHKYDKDLGHSLKDPPENGGYHYMNAKKLNVMDEDDDENLPDYEKYISVDRSSDDPRYAVGFSRAKWKLTSTFPASLSIPT